MIRIAKTIGELMLLMSIAVVVHFAIGRMQQPSSSSVHPLLTVGTQVSISGYDFGISPKTLLLGTAPNCRFSKENKPFHEMLVRHARENGVRILVVAPVSDTSSSFTASFQGPLTTIQQRNLALLGLSGTPTILILNQHSQITGIWQGHLGPVSQNAVLARLGNDQHAITGARDGKTSIISDRNLLDYISKSTVLDVRERVEFAQGHMPGAINIPNEELIVRAPLELSKGGSILLDCMRAQAGDCQVAEQALSFLKYQDVRFLDYGTNEQFCQAEPVR